MSNFIYVAHKSVPTGSTKRLPVIVPSTCREYEGLAVPIPTFPEKVALDPVILPVTLSEARLASDPLVMSFFQFGIYTY